MGNELCKEESFDLTPEQVRRAAYIFAEEKGISVPWNGEEELAGEDLFSNSMQRNIHPSLREPEYVSKGKGAKKVYDEFVAEFGFIENQKNI